MLLFAILACIHAEDKQLQTSNSTAVEDKKLTKRATCSTCSYDGRTYYTYADGTTVERLVYRDPIYHTHSRGI